MNIDRTTTPQKSLGKLRKAKSTNTKAPAMIGKLLLQRHTASDIVRGFEDRVHEVECNIAAWVNADQDGRYLTIEISPKLEHNSRTSLAFVFGNEEE